MKIRSLFDLIQDSRDVVDFFENVETVEQAISRLERIKKREAEEFLACVQALKISTDTTLEETIESSGTIAGDPEDDDFDDGDDDGDDLTDSDLKELGLGEDEKPEVTPDGEEKT